MTTRTEQTARPALALVRPGDLVADYTAAQAIRALDNPGQFAGDPYLALGILMGIVPADVKAAVERFIHVGRHGADHATDAERAFVQQSNDSLKARVADLAQRRGIDLAHEACPGEDCGHDYHDGVACEEVTVVDCVPEFCGCRPRCPECRGQGKILDACDAEHTCKSCRGTGEAES